MVVCHRVTEDTENELKEINILTEQISGCALEVHRNLGPGLLESIYELALAVELGRAGVAFERQVIVPIVYKGEKIGEHQLDLLVNNTVIVEVKSVERHDPLFEAQVLTYLRITGKRLGLLINFSFRLLKNGIKRLIL